jgi:hypothetical protein
MSFRKRREKRIERRRRIRNRLRDFGRDVGTAATRIVTDTAIDLTNVATGFKFNAKLEGAKNKLSKAGIHTTAEIIEENHYGFLKKMEKDVGEKIDSLTALSFEGEKIAAEIERRVLSLFEMLAQAELLSQMCAEAEAIIGPGLSDMPPWKRQQIEQSVFFKAVQQVNTASPHWDQVSALVLASNIAGMGSIAAGLASGNALKRAGKLARAARAAGGSKAMGLSRKSAKFAKIGKLAGRASGVLSIATVGLDIGISVAVLEAKKKMLKKQNHELEAGLLEGKQELSLLRQEHQEIELRINELLTSVTPSQTEISWGDWVIDTKESLRRLRSRTISLEAAMNNAFRLARRTGARGYGKHRVAYVASVDPSVSFEQARLLIERADAENN